VRKWGSKSSGCAGLVKFQMNWEEEEGKKGQEIKEVVYTS